MHPRALRRSFLAVLGRPPVPTPRGPVVLPDVSLADDGEGVWRVVCGCGARRTNHSYDELLAWLDGHACRQPLAG